ncbi:MAG: response regulator [Nitrospirae bacterium]|nr:MAG: response regulator [Nitrospirota bacterium]
MTNDKTVLVAVGDVFFYAKIREALTPRGYALERLKSETGLAERLSKSRPSAMILDLNDSRLDTLALLRTIKTNTIWKDLPVLAFANHEDVDTWRQAKGAGIDKIVSRNEFSARTLALLEELTVAPPAT